MEPIRILYVNGGIMSRGGIESYMMNYYRNLDRKKIQIDFIVHGFEKGVYDDEITSLGGKIYNVPVKSKNYIGNIKAIRSIFLSGNYNIIHSHVDAMSAVILKEAKKCGIQIRIAHSHNTQHLTNNKIKFLLNEYARKKIKKYATHLFACSDEAGRWLFGEEEIKSNNVTLINNAINIEKFKFDIEKRQELRRKLGIHDEFVIGHVGRFDYQKNHIFLLNVFNQFLTHVPNAKLILVGDGHLKNEIIDKVKALSIENNVIMLGARSDVNELNNIFDMFILPSLFEGLPVVAIEAQANGLNCILSDEITNEVNITKNIKFISLNSKYEIWTDEIMNIFNNSRKRECDYDLFKKCGYDIKSEAKKLEKIYFKLMEEL